MGWFWHNGVTARDEMGTWDCTKRQTALEDFKIMRRIYRITGWDVLDMHSDGRILIHALEELIGYTPYLSLQCFSQ